MEDKDWRNFFVEVFDLRLGYCSYCSLGNRFECEKIVDYERFYFEEVKSFCILYRRYVEVLEK